MLVNTLYMRRPWPDAKMVKLINQQDLNDCYCVHEKWKWFFSLNMEERYYLLSRIFLYAVARFDINGHIRVNYILEILYV